MQQFRVFTAIMLMATVSVGAASAQSLRNADEPAEFPPTSYTGKQYVDSKGCVYIRAGFSGNVTWVPRVSRSRQQICGQTPTFAKVPAPEVPRVATTTPIPKPAPAPAAAPAPKPTPVVRAPVVRPAPQRVVRTPAARPAPTPAPTATRIAGPTAQVPAATTPATPKPRRVVRRTAAAPIAAPAKPTAAPTRTPRAQTRRVAAPKPTRAAAAAPAQRVVRRVAPRKPPAGYRAAWTDDRLNPNRARGTAEGQAQMEMVWTNTVPRRLVSATTGRTVTSQVIVRNPLNTNDGTARATGGGTDMTVSTKTVPGTRIRTTSAAALSHRFVQVGTYGQPANAKKAVARMRALGLPVRLGKVQRNGKPLQIVLAGPFTRQANLKAALSAARRAGYRDAILRK